jgi:hypothetical protein
MQLAATSSLLSSANLQLLSTGFGVVSTFAGMRAQQAALERENQRIAVEAQMAKLSATQDENDRMDAMNRTLASNLAFQSIAGYYDDSRSFLNIQEQTRKNAEKDLAQIRLMGAALQSKYGQLQYENIMQKEDLTFGGWASIGKQLTTGYVGYLDEKEVQKAVD